VNRLETLRQGKKTAKELNTEFLQIVGQAGIDRKTLSDHLHLIGYYRKTLEPRLSRRILFSNNVPKTINGWMEKAIQYNTNWRMGNLFLNQENPSVTTSNNVSELSLYSRSVLSETLLSTVVD
jgi:hypothetical protein